MKRSGWLAAICVLSAVPAFCADGPPPYYWYRYGPETSEHRSITAGEAIAAALENASTYTQKTLESEAIAEEVQQSRAALLPDISLPVTYLGNTPSSRRVAGEPRPPSFAPMVGVHETSAFLRATGAVDTSGALRASVRRARELLGAARDGNEVARRNLCLATIDAYYGLSLARQTRRLADETLALAEAFVLLTRQIAEETGADDTDLLRAEMEALRLRDELEQHRVGESVAENLLRSLTAIPFTVHIGVSRPSAEIPSLEPFASYDDRGLTEWPQIREIDSRRRAATAEIDFARAQRRPQFTYDLTAGFDTVGARDVGAHSGAAGLLGVSFPLFHFGAYRSLEKRARLLARAEDVGREMALRELRAEFLTARATAFAARERIRFTQGRSVASERVLNRLLERYRSGRATITEITDAQDGYATSRLAHYQAITDYHVSRARLVPDPAKLDFQSRPWVSEPQQASPCTIERESAPSLAGLSLGDSLVDVSSRFPRAVTEHLEKLSVTAMEIPGADLTGPSVDDARFRIESGTLYFDAGRLAYFRIVFARDGVWETKDAFLAAASRRFGMPVGPWRAFYDWSDKNLEDAEDLRELAVECHGFSIRLGLGFLSEGITRTLTPHIEIQDTALWTAAKRREADRHRQRAAR